MIVPVQDPTPFSPFEPAGWKGALVEVAASGYRAVELAITDPAALSEKEVAEALKEAGLRLSSLTTGQAAALEGLNLSSENDALREMAIARIQDHMELAAPHGAVVIVGLLRGADGRPDLLVDSLRECARFDPGVKLALEPLNRYESRLVNTVAEALAIIDRVGAENLGILFDTFHANIEEPDLRAAIRLARGRIFHVHLADSNRWIPGHGHLDFPPLMEELAEAGYRGALVVEALLKPDPKALLSFPSSAESVLWGRGEAS
jgi:sugar phosphate isomerase/epimerase